MHVYRIKKKYIHLHVKHFYVEYGDMYSAAPPCPPLATPMRAHRVSSWLEVVVLGHLSGVSISFGVAHFWSLDGSLSG